MRTPTRLRATAVAAVLPLALLGLSACGGDDAEPASAETSSSADAGDDADGGDGADAAAETVGERSEGEEVSVDDMVALMVGAFEKGTTADITMTTAAAGQEIEATGQADYTGDTPALRMDMEVGTGGGALSGVGNMSVVLLEDTMYLQIGALGDSWLSTDLSDPTNPLGSQFTDQLDPSRMADVLGEGMTSAVYVGTEEVDGEDLEHYTATVDSSALLEGTGQDLAGAEGVLAEEISYELYFDAEGLYRRMEVDLGPAAGDMVMRFDDWGTDVDIEAPPADQVKDMTDVLGGGGLA